MRRAALAFVLFPALAAAGPEPQPGSAFDFSMPFPMPGSLGRVVADGNDLRFERDKPGTHRVFVGTNLTGMACFPASDAQAAQWAKSLHLRGYNAVRLHHIDWVLRDKGWQMKAAADRFIAALKQEGIYITIDLFSQRAKDISAFKRGVLNGDSGTRADWAGYTKRLLTTPSADSGCEAWKDEPAIIGICPLNEDDPRFIGASPSGYGAAFAWMATTIRATGYKGLLWGLNSGIDKSLVEQTKKFGAEDFHVYWDHPQGTKFLDTSGVRQPWQLPGVIRPDLPTICTEWGSLPYNKLRGETGLMFAGQMAARQTSAILSFALATNEGMMTGSKAPIDQFAFHTDPVRLATERVMVLLMRRPGAGAQVNWTPNSGIYRFASSTAKIDTTDFLGSLDGKPLGDSGRLLLIRFGDAQNSGFSKQAVDRVVNRLLKAGGLPVRETSPQTPYELDSNRKIEAWSLDSYTGTRLRRLKCEQTTPGHWRIATTSINTEVVGS